MKYNEAKNNEVTIKKAEPNWNKRHVWETYDLSAEFRQCKEEGLDILQYEKLFAEVSKMPNGAHKEKISDVLFDIVLNAETVKDYPYNEPSDLENIRRLRVPYSFKKAQPSEEELYEKVYGAWLGRVCGCLLGKPIECIKRKELLPLLKETGNYPMHRYILSKDIDEEKIKKYEYPLAGHSYADTVDGMPADDDITYTVLNQKVIESYGCNFAAENVAEEWLNSQTKDCYCTAERVAFCNFVNGYEPPISAVYKNPYREWIGAQIRGDYYGYINPGDPETAAKMAYRDATLSHVKNGIYGEMFVAGMLACAAVAQNMVDIVLGGLAEIPATSRLYESISGIVKDYENGVRQEEVFGKIFEKYDDTNEHDWCHTISNASIVAASLLYGEGDFEKSVCMAVESGFDTDCNGATVGSVVGMKIGEKNVPFKWREPIGDKIHTLIFGLECVSLSECVQKTIKHINQTKKRDHSST